MFKKQQEEHHLALADRHIAQAEERIRVQLQRLKDGKARGEIIETREALLSKMVDSLVLMKIHREQILARLADLNKFP